VQSHFVNKKIARIDNPQPFCLHRHREMAGVVFTRCSSMLVHHSGQSA
jgi:hypothetical protein